MKTAWATGAALLALVRLASADVRETAHTATIRVAGNVAFLDVTRSFANPGEYDSEATLGFELPPGAVATSLRVEQGGRWQAGVLRDAERAQERFDALGGERSKGVPLGTPALLAQGDDELQLALYRVPARGTRRVAYTLVAPLARVGGQRRLDYPTGGGQPELRAPGAHVERAATTVHLSWQGAPRELNVRSGSLLMPSGPLWRVEVDAPLALAPDPGPHSVVFVIDRSRSEGRAGLAAQLALMRAYLDAAPLARYTVVAFDRRAERLTAGFLAASDDELPHLDANRNGSDLGAALVEAGRALAGARGERRLIVLTDGLLPSQDELPALPGITAHVVLRGRADGGGDVVRKRIFERTLAEWAHAQGGMLLAITGGEPDGLARAAVVLVRPVRLDQVAAGEDAEVIGDLDEGGGLRATGRGAVPRLSAWRWGRQIELSPRPLAAISAQLPALALPELDLDDQDEAWLAGLAGAVSGSTSYLVVASEPRNDPPLARFRSRTAGVVCGIPIGTADGTPPSLRPPITPILRACGARAGHVEVGLSGDEIVAVRAQDTGADACVEEALWNLALPEAVPGHMRFYDFDVVRLLQR